MGQPNSNSSNNTKPSTEEEMILSGLLAGATDQSVLEKTLEQKLLQDLKRRDNENDEKRLKKTSDRLRATRNELDSLLEKLDKDNIKISTKKALVDKISASEEMIDILNREMKEIEDRMDGRRPSSSEGGGGAEQKDLAQQNEETTREMLIRTGKITPFDRGTDENSARAAAGRTVKDLTIQKQREKEQELTTKPNPIKKKATKDLESIFEEEGSDVDIGADSDVSDEYKPESLKTKSSSSKRKTSSAKRDDDYKDDIKDNASEEGEELEEESDGDELVEDEDGTFAAKKKYETVDDGNEYFYQRRYGSWVKARRIARFTRENPDFQYDSEDEDSPVHKDIFSEPFHPHTDDLKLNRKFIIPGEIASKLFPYQLTTLSWLLELHDQQTGGILGDEMGLGKTIQMIAFLAGLHRSGMLGKGRPILVVAPATVLRQWAKEFHEWWGAVRVVILHSSGSGIGGGGGGADGNRRRGDISSEEEEMSDSEDDDDRPAKKRKRSNNNNSKKTSSSGGGTTNTKVQQQVKELVDRVVEKGHVILTTYEGVRVYQNQLLPINWAYAVLDEGHKIRNADADITLVCKKLKTPNRIILSGTPIQNNLKELWSLYDFVFPGRLGTLPVFLTQFEVPIRLGAYANATNIQVQTAQRCAAVLRDLISPYLLRRLKCDVASDLPQKTESVLFCKLTREQRKLYEEYIEGDAVMGALEGKRNALGAIDGVRKICNHPDLLKRDKEKMRPDYGDPMRSGKMQVVKALLDMWKKQGHRALVFCQTRQMQEILEKMILNEGHKYFRMDGMTPIKNRIGMVDSFNSDPSVTVFLLTTKVGGLGINLTGANRVLIFDPDWNPSTDVQARERAWRLGQTRDVAVYRLMMSGTIEEKIYHRQIYKQFLTNKILSDPSGGGGSHKRFFDSRSMRDLFTLTDASARGTETGDMFRGTEVAGKTGNATEPKSRYSSASVPANLVPVGRSVVKDPDVTEQAKVEADEDGGDALDGIDHLASVEEFQTGEPEKKPTPVEDEEESRMLFSLLHSTVAHDKIMNGDGAAVDPLALAHADRVAREAAEEVRLSRKRVRAEQKKASLAHGGEYVGVVTFTGNSGSAGRSISRPQSSNSKPATHPPQPTYSGANQSGNSGLSSASLLAGLKKRYNTK